MGIIWITHSSPADGLWYNLGLLSFIYSFLMPWNKQWESPLPLTLAVFESNLPDTCISGETQNSKVIYWSFENQKGLFETGYSHHGISRWHRTFWKDDSEKQGSLVNQSIFALCSDFNATFTSTKLSLRSRLYLVQVWEARDGAQKSWAEHRGNEAF